MQIGKKIPGKGMNREAKAADKISLVEANLISIWVTSSFFVTRDPNFYRIKELVSVPNPFLVLLRKRTWDVPGLIGGRNRSAPKTLEQSSNEDNPISRSLDLTPDILHNLATSAEWETKGNKEERTEVYGQSFPTKELILSRHSPSTNSSKLPKWAKKKAMEGQSAQTVE